MHVVINYFNPKGSRSLRAMVQTAMYLYAENSHGTHTFCLLDGSGFPDPEVAAACDAAHFRYLPSTVREAFAQTYNRGIDACEGDDVVVAASDIFVPKGWDKVFLKAIESRYHGMIIPYLSSSDYVTQQTISPRLRRTIFPLSCTLNMNFLSSSVKGDRHLDDRFSGGFNDIDLLIRLRQAGAKVVLTDCGPVKHLGKMTVSVATSWNMDNDYRAFAALYPQFTSSNWWYKAHKPVFCASPLLRAVLGAAYYIMPLRIVLRLHRLELVMNEVDQETSRHL